MEHHRRVIGERFPRGRDERISLGSPRSAVDERTVDLFEQIEQPESGCPR